MRPVAKAHLSCFNRFISRARSFTLASYGKEIKPLFFTSCIIIAFFCFAFYLIWNQFLKKDTRLNTGLKVLRKKISDLQNLSLAVDTQIDRHSSVMNDKIQRLEYLLQKSKEACQQMEKTIELASQLKNKDYLHNTPGSEQTQGAENRASEGRHTESPPLSLTESSSSSAIKGRHLKMVKNKPAQQKQPYFGESPFIKLGFVEPPGTENKKPSIEHPLNT